MLRTIYAMLSNASHYQDKEVDYEALNVQRNAPRWIKMLREARLHRHARCRLRLDQPADLAALACLRSGVGTSGGGCLPH